MNTEHLRITLREPITKKTIFFALLLFSTMGVLLAESKWGQQKVREYHARIATLEHKAGVYDRIRPHLDRVEEDARRFALMSEGDSKRLPLCHEISIWMEVIEDTLKALPISHATEYGSPSGDFLTQGGQADIGGGEALLHNSILAGLNRIRGELQVISNSLELNSGPKKGTQGNPTSLPEESASGESVAARLVVVSQAVNSFHKEILTNLMNARAAADGFPARLMSIQVTTACFLGGLCLLFAVVAVVQIMRVVGAREMAIQRLNVELDARVAAEEGLKERTEQLERAVSIMEAAMEEAAEATAKAKAAHEAKSEFFAKMSHELRTPLHGVLSFARFGVSKYETSPREKLLDYFEKIERSGTTLLGFLNDLLDLAKHDAHKMVYQFEPMNMGSTVANVVDEFSSIVVERDLEVRYTLPTICTQVSADQAKVKQVIRNLLSNAIKHSPAGTSIEIDVESDDAMVMTSVRDHGPGIPNDELDTVFERFVQSKKTKSGDGGTGLGLAICREIVTDHGGTVIATNHIEGGAVFSFQIPLAGADVEVEAIASGSE